MLVGGAKRLYGIVEGGDLAYVEERVDADGGLVPHLSARLSGSSADRVTGIPIPAARPRRGSRPRLGGLRVRCDGACDYRSRPLSAPRNDDARNDDIQQPPAPAAASEHGGLPHCLSEHGVTESTVSPADQPPGVDQATWDKAIQACSSLAPGPGPAPGP